MATIDFVVKNGLTVTDSATINGTTDSTAHTDGSLVVKGGVGVAKKLFVGTDLSVAGTTTFTGDLAVNGGDITTTVTGTATLFNTNATTGNIFGAATAVSIGAATGTTTINNANTAITGDLAVNGGDITTSATTFNLLNTTVTTGNLFGAGTAIAIGAATGTTTVNNASFIHNSTGATRIATGDNAQRPGGVSGMIRYNTQISAFEGYAGTAWSSLGGVKSVDGLTYIIAETSAGASNGELEFYAEDATGLVAVKIGGWNYSRLLESTGTIVGSNTTQNVFNTTATTVNAFGAATALTIGSNTSATITLRPGTLVGSNTTQNVYNTVATTVNAFGASTATTIGSSTSATLTVNPGTLVGANTTQAVFNTVATTVNAFGASTATTIGSSSAATLTVNPGTLVGANTTQAVFNTVATTVNAFGVSTSTNVATSAAALATLTFGPAITGNIFKIGSTAAGTINLTTDVTTGIVNAYTGVTTGTLNLVTGGASTTNIGGAAAAVNIGTTGGDSTLTIRGNATTGTGTLATNAATANVFNANASTVNIAGAGTAIGIGATTGTVTIANPTLTMNNATSVAFNMNGPTPTIASTNTGTASIFNANIVTINFGQAADIIMGGTAKKVEVRGNLEVDGNTTIGDANTDTITFNASSASTPNTLTFNIDDAVTNAVSYPVKIGHTTSGTAAIGMGAGITFIAENASGTNVTGATVEAVASNVTNTTEAFNLVFKTMTAGAAAAQSLLINNSTLTVGAANTAQTINTQVGSNLTVTPGAVGVTAAGATATFSGGAGGVTSGAGGAATFKGGDATAGTTGGTATLRAGAAVGTNIVGANTILEAGNGTGSGGSGSILFRAAPAAASGTTPNVMATVLTISSSGLDIPGSLIIGGNLTVNGTTTTVNSSTVTVDDKNIELGSVAAATISTTGTVGSIVGAASPWTATITGMTTTAGLIVGSTIGATNGVGSIGGGGAYIVTAINSSTSVTYTATGGTTPIAGAITNVTTTGATDATANGGGITLLGATNKTLTWLSSTARWTSNVGFEATVIDNTPIGSNTRAAGAFTTLTSNAATTFTLGTEATNSTTGGTLTVTGGLGVSGRIYAGSIQNTPIGSITRNTGAFTDIDFNGNAIFGDANTDTITVNAAMANGQAWKTATTVGTTFSLAAYDTDTGPAYVNMLTLTAGTTPTLSIGSNSGSTAINYATIGATSAASGAFTSLTANAAVTFTANTASSTTGSGTLVVTGGVGVSGQVTATTVSATNYLVTTASSTEASGLAVQRVYSKSVSAGQLYQLGRWTDTEGTTALLIQVSSETGSHSGTSTYLWQGANGTIAGSYYKLLPLADGRGAGDAADTGLNDNAWNVWITGTTVSGAATTHGLAVSVPVGRTGKTLVVTVTELKRGMTYVDDSAVAVITSWTNSGTVYSHRNISADGIISGASIQNTPVGSTTRASGAFTTLTSNASTTLTAGTASTSTTTGTLIVTGGVGISGALNATSKSFVIDHPTQPNKLLRHGSLEGPEFGVYTRGRCQAHSIELPEYWKGLVDEDTITVDLTPCGDHQRLYVEKVSDNRVYIGHDALYSKTVDYFYTVWGTRKDVAVLEVEGDK
jgi:hypothetical protein